MTQPTTRAARAKRKGKPSGRATFEPTPEQRTTVELHAAFGTPHEDICLNIKKVNGQPISLPTLYKRFKNELASGSTRAVAKAAGKLYTLAMGGNITALVFYLKTRGGWRESEQPVRIPLPADGGLTAQGMTIIQAVAAGKLPVNQGAALLTGLSAVARLKEVDDLTARIEKLEGVSHGKT